jgi:hypothetical protein
LLRIRKNTARIPDGRQHENNFETQLKEPPGDFPAFLHLPSPSGRVFAAGLFMVGDALPLPSSPFCATCSSLRSSLLAGFFGDFFEVGAFFALDAAFTLAFGLDLAFALGAFGFAFTFPSGFSSFLSGPFPAGGERSFSFFVGFAGGFRAGAGMGESSEQSTLN